MEIYGERCNKIKGSGMPHALWFPVIPAHAGVCRELRSIDLQLSRKQFNLWLDINGKDSWQALLASEKPCGMNKTRSSQCNSQFFPLFWQMPAKKHRAQSCAPGQLHYLAYQRAQNLAWLRRWHGRGARRGWGPTSAADRPSGTRSPGCARGSPFRSG